MNENRVSREAVNLIYDLANGCRIHRSKGGAPSSITPATLGGYKLKTGGKASDAAVDELLKHGLISEDYPISDSGTDYYDRYLKNSK